MDLINDQIKKIEELFASEHEQPRNETVETILYVAGNILFVIASLILVWKGAFYLYDYFFPPSSYSYRDRAVRTSVDRLIRHPQIILFLIAAALFIVRILVAIKIRIKPFYILSFLGLALLIKKLWVVAFQKDHSSFLNFLEDYGKDLLK